MNIPKFLSNNVLTRYQMSEILIRVKNSVDVEENKLYKQIGIRSHAKGIFFKEPVSGKELGNKRVFWIEPDCFIVNIVFAWERAIARTSEQHRGYVASHRFPMYKANEELVDLDYITFMFKTKKGQYLLELASPGGAGRNKTLGQNEFGKLEVALPSLESQKKIVKLLLLLDRKKKKQKDKVEELEQFKKGMMQKIFSQELRFKDEDGGEFGEWGETTFGEVSISMQYGMNSAAKEFDGENKYIRITDIDESSRRYIESGKVSPFGNLSEEYRIKSGDILFARTGASTGKSYLYKESDGKMYYAGFLIRLRVRDGVDSRFVYYQTLLKEYDQWVKVMSMRSGQPGINAQEYSSYKFNLPRIEEQIRIADFLDGIENKIEKEREKLRVLEEQKKGFMQGMFV